MLLTFESRAVTDVLTSCVLNLWQKILCCVTIVEWRGLPPDSDICWGKGEKSLFGHIDTTNRALPYGTIFQTHNGVKTLMCLIWRCVLISSLSLERSMTPPELRGRTRCLNYIFVKLEREPRRDVLYQQSQIKVAISYFTCIQMMVLTWFTQMCWSGEWACIVRLKDKTKNKELKSALVKPNYMNECVDRSRGFNWQVRGFFLTVILSILIHIMAVNQTQWS